MERTVQHHRLFRVAGAFITVLGLTIAAPSASAAPLGQDESLAQTLQRSDSFGRPNGALGNLWSGGTAWQVNTGVARPSGTPTSSATNALWREIVLGKTFAVSATIVLPSAASGWTGFAINATAGTAPSYYAARVRRTGSGSAGEWQVVHVTGGGTAVVLGTGPLTLPSDGRVPLTVSPQDHGTALRVQMGAVAQDVPLPRSTLLIGGAVGLHHMPVAGTAVGAIDDVVLSTSSAPASNPAGLSDSFARPAGSAGTQWTALRGAWQIQSDQTLRSSGAAPERLVTAQGVVAGSSLRVGATVSIPATSPGYRAWGGIATNVQNHGDGTQSFYALRIAQHPDNLPTGLWQLVRVDNSGSVGSGGLLASGTAPMAPGSKVRIALESVAGGSAFQVEIGGVGTSPAVVKEVELPAAGPLIGGGVGLYDSSANRSFDDVRITTNNQASTGLAIVDDSFERPNGALGSSWSSARGTWQIASGSVFATGTQAERLAVNSLTLGQGFRASVVVSAPATPLAFRPWTGLAVNVSDHGDGTQSFYALRLTPLASDAVNGVWQVVRVNRSQPVTTSTLLATENVPVPAGGKMRLTLESAQQGTALNVRVTNLATGQTSEQLVGLPRGETLVGGRAGIYGGTMHVDGFRLSTDGQTAATPPQPGPLNCGPTVGDNYALPGGGQTVSQVIPVDDTWAGHPVGQSVVTSATHQYVAYYDADRTMTIASRALSSTTWTYQPLDSVVGWDSHNYVTMSLDAAGQLHVAGNMHATALQYWRTSVAGDIATLTRIAPMTDSSRESHVTYPSFSSGPGGTLLFSYRQGDSSSGVTYYNSYNPTTQTWAPLLSTPIVDGEGTRNPYLGGPRLGPDGFYHLVWVWRDTGDVATNSLISYLRSPDLINWQKSDGTPVTLPATYSTGEVIDPVLVNGGLLNGGLGMGFDHNGKVVVTYFRYDDQGGTQVFGARPNGDGTWSTTQISNWTGRWDLNGLGSIGLQARVQGIATLPDGKLSLRYFCGQEERTWVLDGTSLAQIADVVSPSYPTAVMTVQSTFPGMTVNLNLSATPTLRYVLRWESLAHNNDQPRPPGDTPPPGPLEVYVLAPS